MLERRKILKEAPAGRGIHPAQPRGDRAQVSTRRLQVITLKYARIDTSLKGITDMVTERMKDQRFQDQPAPLLVPDVRTEPRYVEANPKVMSEMAVPVKWGGEVMGVINLDHYEVGGFSEEDLELLTAFGHVAAVALRHAHAIDDGPPKPG